MAVVGESRGMDAVEELLLKLTLLDGIVTSLPLASKDTEPKSGDCNVSFPAVDNLYSGGA